MTIRRLSLYGTLALFAAAIAAFALLFWLSRGDPPVAATVIDNAALPAIEIGGIRLHAESFGNPAAPVIIVLHGGPGGDYAGLLPLQALADTYQVVFYDQRGAGLSERVPADALTLDRYLEELDAIAARYSPNRRVILIGHSWGAMLASAYMALHPLRVTRAVLMEPGYLNAAEFAAWQSRARGMMSGFSFLKASIWNGFRAAHVSGPDAAAADDFLIGEMVAAFANYSENPYHCPGQPYDAPTWRFGALASTIASAPAAEELARLVATPPARAKVLLMAGACNSWTGAPLQRQHLALFADSRLAVIPDAGHAMLTDNPAATLASLRRFLKD